MMMLCNSLMVFLVSAFVFGCTKRPTTSAQMNISVANLVQLSSLQGGVYLMMRSTDGTQEYFDIPSSYQLPIPLGEFDLFFTAYTGPDSWAGDMYCGLLEKTVIQGESIVLDVTLSRGQCSTRQEYSAMNRIKNPLALWDVALWDQAKWAP